MTEIDEAAPKSGGWPESSAGLVHTADWYGAPDSRLQWMADTADYCNAGIGITLVVPGGTISGTLISAGKFFEATAAEFREALGDDLNESGEALAHSFFDVPAEIDAEYTKKINDAFHNGERDEPRWPMLRHIHLQDARFSVPGQEFIPLGNLRVLLSQVIAWTVGQRWVSRN